jgi:hypothetical protein
LKNLNEEIYLVGEMVYKPFFNEKFGPILNQVEVEIVAHYYTEKIKNYLLNHHSHYRWKFHEKTIEEYMVNSPFTFLQAAIVVNEEENSIYYYSEESRNDLINGFIEPSFAYARDKKTKAEELIGLYPGCSSRFFRNENPFEMFGWDKIEGEIHDKEKGGRKCQDLLTNKEMEIAERIKKWHDENKKEKLLVPIPKQGALPYTVPWEAKDEEFREWFIRQTLMDDITLESDPYLSYVLNLQRVKGQKPTHDGWEIYHHSIMSALQIETEDLMPNLRKILRLTMIWHDVGKLRNVWTPGAHGAIGSKIWKKPNWIDEKEEILVKLLIKTHDYLGLMDRWLQDSDFKGGVSPKKIREICRSIDWLNEKEVFELMKRVYDADISSVSRLRHFLPLTPLLEEIVLCEM